MANFALGFFEVLGYSVALASMDKACKCANIKIEGIDCNNPVLGDKADIPLNVQVKISGNISDVKVALDEAKKFAMNYIDEKDILIHCIPSSLDELNKFLSIGKVKIK